MAWVTLTTTDAEAAMSDALASAYATYLLSHEDPLPTLLQRAVAVFRQSIAGWPANTLDDEEDTLPLSCVRPALAIILFDLYLLLPDEAEVDVRTAYEKAEIFLRGLPHGNPAVEHPDGAAAASGAPAYTPPSNTGALTA